jgi:hypothetical protein
MFDYSTVSWENLKYEFINGDNPNLEAYSFEGRRGNGENDATNYPFIADLKTKAESDKWFELAASSTELKARRLEEQISLRLKEKLDKLSYLNRTIDFARKAQRIIEGAMPAISDSMSRHSQVADMEPLDRARYFSTLVKVYETLNKIERESLGVGNVGAIIEEVYNAFGEGKSIEQVLEDVKGMDENAITELFADVIKS